MNDTHNCPKCLGTKRVLCTECGGGGMTMGCFCQVCDIDGKHDCSCTIRISRRQARKNAKAAKTVPWAKKTSDKTPA